jgi:ATP-dependent DNA helicase RecG
LADAEIAELMTIAERVNRTKFRDQVLKPLLADNLLAMTIPDKPTSRNQRYRTTDKGRVLLVILSGGGA